MRRIALAVLILAVAPFAFADDASRTFDAAFTATIANIPADAGVLNVWIPIPTTRGCCRCICRRDCCRRCA